MINLALIATALLIWRLVRRRKRPLIVTLPSALTPDQVAVLYADLKLQHPDEVLVFQTRKGAARRARS